MLLDTSGLLCLSHRAELYHFTARSFYRAARRKLTHSYVLAEFIALATARSLPRGPSIRFLQDLVLNPEIETVWVDRPLHDEALTLLKKRQDKTYSLCDAVSFVLMRERDVQDALSTDRHFAQEGFRRLLV